ncbi:MAG: ISL3 family transposase [Flectobacillus sp.]|uniref:ISL3 family transposase n=1 Tax=Flectobacillus sp. TaxID=50419 RepID=UPI003B9DB7FD
MFVSIGAEICQQIQVVSCDILDSYILASRQCFPNAEITLDHFHIVKALNESLDAVRKSLRKTYQTHQEFKNIKWLLFKQAQNCTEEQTHLLNLAFEKSPTLHQFYIQRNRFHAIYQSATDAENMTHLLNDWIEQATKLEHPKTNKFIKTLQNWMANIASYANTFATNAVTEGL